MQIEANIISLLVSDPRTMVKVGIEVSAEFLARVSGRIKRVVAENSADHRIKNNGQRVSDGRRWRHT